MTEVELKEIGVRTYAGNHSLPWALALRRANLWAMFAVVFCYAYGLYFFVSWLHTFLVRARGFSEGDLLFSVAPPILGAIGNLSGGYLSDRLCKTWGLKWGRRSVGLIGLSMATIFMVATILTTNKLATLLFLGLVYGGITSQQSVFAAVQLDIARKYIGGIFGAVNMFSSVGAFCFSVSFGYYVTWFGSYDLALVPVALMFAVAALAWLRVDATEELIPEPTDAVAHAAS